MKFQLLIVILRQKMLYEGNYQQLNTITTRFFGRGPIRKEKYHMVKWEAVNRPKDYGVLSYGCYRQNICLMSKSIGKLERGEKSISHELLRRKILGSKENLSSEMKKGPQFRGSLLDIKRVVSIRQKD
jgi:hypothetical protein